MYNMYVKRDINAHTLRARMAMETTELLQYQADIYTSIYSHVWRTIEGCVSFGAFRLVMWNFDGRRAFLEVT